MSKNKEQDNKHETYKKVFERPYNSQLDSDDENQGFGKEYKNIKNLYNYNRYFNGKKGYDDIIQDKIKKGNTSEEYKDVIDSDFMHLINWIALWKTNRIIEIDNIYGVKKELETIKSIRSVDENKESIETILSNLLDCKGIQLAMASTILHFYNPKVFPIIDKRAWRAIQLIDFDEMDDGKYTICDKKDKKIKIISSKKDEQIGAYFGYIKDCEKLCEKLDGEMETVDKFLYQIDKIRGENIENVHIYNISKK